MREPAVSTRIPSRGGSGRTSRGNRGSRNGRHLTDEQASERYYVILSRPDTPPRRSGHLSLAAAEVHAASLVDRYDTYGYTWEGDADRGVSMFQDGERKIEIRIEHP